MVSKFLCQNKNYLIPGRILQPISIQKDVSCFSRVGTHRTIHGRRREQRNLWDCLVVPYSQLSHKFLKHLGVFSQQQ